MAECRVSKLGHCDLDLWVKGQMFAFLRKMLVRGITYILKAYMHMHNIWYIYVLGQGGVLRTKMRSL